jgi:cation diffusion facilitator family transporter
VPATSDATTASDPLEQVQQQDPPPARTWPLLVTLTVVSAEAAVLAFAAWRSGSAVLFAEAAQSLAGAAVEVFLLVGVRRASRPPDDAHPLGYGREAFFWSLLASVGVFVGGGTVSIAYGIAALGRTEHGGEQYLLGYIVLSVIVVADTLTLVEAIRPFRRSAIVGRMGFRRGLRHTADAGARTLIFDNAAAVLGSVVGIIGLAVHQATGDPRSDAYASLVIGVLLLATTVVLLHVNRELLTDRSIAPEVVAAMRDRIAGQDGVVDVPELLAVYTGPHDVLVTGTVALADGLDVVAVEDALAEAGASLKQRWPGRLRVYLAPVPTAGRARGG